MTTASPLTHGGWNFECNLPFPRRIAVLGASGTIGTLALKVIANSQGKLDLTVMSVHRNTAELAEIIRRLQSRKTHETPCLPQCVVVTDETADRTPLENLPPEIEVVFGHDSLCRVLERADIDIVLSAIVGSAGLRSTLAALELGKTVALANKESLVVGGPLVMDVAAKNGALVLPVDSEHSAIMQCLGDTPNSENVARLILTASGGPFRTLSQEELKQVTVANALAHPVWRMGKKITIDSATLMNKALELIEARWLFQVDVHRLAVMIHPQSIIHSMVEFVDGSVMAQMSPPDMTLPIQFALCYPHRFAGVAKRFDWTEHRELTFYPPDLERFPAISLGLEVIESGGTSGAVLNAANEVAVAAFLEEKLPFHRITEVCGAVLHGHHHETNPTLEQLLRLDNWAREETRKWMQMFL